MGWGEVGGRVCACAAQKVGCCGTAAAAGIGWVASAGGRQLKAAWASYSAVIEAVLPKPRWPRQLEETWAAGSSRTTFGRSRWVEKQEQCSDGGVLYAQFSAAPTSPPPLTTAMHQNLQRHTRPSLQMDHLKCLRQAAGWFLSASKAIIFLISFFARFSSQDSVPKIGNYAHCLALLQKSSILEK